jgi:hypothetical protein
MALELRCWGREYAQETNAFRHIERSEEGDVAFPLFASQALAQRWQ